MRIKTQTEFWWCVVKIRPGSGFRRWSLSESFPSISTDGLDRARFGWRRRTKRFEHDSSSFSEKKRFSGWLRRLFSERSFRETEFRCFWMNNDCVITLCSYISHHSEWSVVVSVCDLNTRLYVPHHRDVQETFSSPALHFQRSQWCSVSDASRGFYFQLSFKVRGSRQHEQ